jgi:transposase-like protein
VKETPSALLHSGADRLCNAERYERGGVHRDTRAGHNEHKLQAGEVRLSIPNLRQQTFEMAIIERYRRREGSVEETLWARHSELSTASYGRGLVSIERSQATEGSANQQMRSAIIT